MTSFWTWTFSIFTAGFVVGCISSASIILGA